MEAQTFMDQMLEPLSVAAVAAADLTEGERAIDIGCGCGATSFALAEGGGEVWGLDISEPMVARARERAQGLSSVAFSVGDAATQPYTPDHQLIFSRFGVMFFEDPPAAFAHMRSALVEGGRLVFICWQAPKENLWMSVAGRAVQPFLPPPAEAPDPRAPGPFAFADRGWIEDILGSAGYSDISIESLNRDLTIGRTVEDAMYLQGRIGPMARALAELDDAAREEAKAAVRSALADYETDAGVVLGSGAWLVHAANGA